MKLNEIRTGQSILVHTEDGFLPETIQWFQSKVNKKGGKWNHAGMFWIAYEKVFVIEAIQTGIAITPIDDYLDHKKYELMVLKPKFTTDGSEYGKFMLPYCGRTKYDRWNLLVAQPVSIISDGEIWLGGHDNSKKYICGGWCAFVHNHFTGTFGNPQRYSPVMLFESDQFTHETIEY